MSSIRVLSLTVLAAASLALPAYVAFAQPDTKPAPAAQPAGDPKPGDAAPGRGPAGQPGQPGEGGRGGQPGGPGGRGQPGGRGGEGAGVPQSTKQGMSVMNRALRTLKSQVADAAKKDENLKLVADMQRGCLGAKSAMPDRQLGRETEQAKKDELALKYRKDLIVMMQKLLALETAILDGKADAADKLVDEIEALRDAGHKDLGVRG